MPYTNTSTVPTQKRFLAEPLQQIKGIIEMQIQSPIPQIELPQFVRTVQKSPYVGKVKKKRTES